jgi:hypothetical protein
VFLVVIKEVLGDIRTIPIKNQYTIPTKHLFFYVQIKMLKPLNSQLIFCKTRLRPGLKNVAIYVVVKVLTKIVSPLKITILGT